MIIIPSLLFIVVCYNIQNICICFVLNDFVLPLTVRLQSGGRMTENQSSADSDWPTRHSEHNSPITIFVTCMCKEHTGRLMPPLFSSHIHYTQRVTLFTLLSISLLIYLIVFPEPLWYCKRSSDILNLLNNKDISLNQSKLEVLLDSCPTWPNFVPLTTNRHTLYNRRVEVMS